MEALAAASYDERVLLVAPTRRDGDIARRALASAGVDCALCPNLADLVRRIDEGVGALLLTDWILADKELGALLTALDRQPSWSSVPIVFLSQARGGAASAQHRMVGLRNVTVLDRPASMRSMISAIKASLRGRRWQYQIRDHLAEQQQIQAQLRQANQHKDEFLATLAHELRNPLAPIATGLQILKRSMPCAQDQPQLFDVIERQLGQLVKLIDELLDVSRIASGKVMLQREVIDLRSVIEQAVEAHQPAMSSARHTLSVDLPSQALCVFGDASRLAQAVGNLLHNAIKYTPKGGLLRISLLPAGTEAVMTVSDTGAGIPPQMLAKVFDMFAQVDRTLERSQGGLGIGLSLVRNLVSLHGGTVTAGSAGIDRGSSFEIRLPTVRDAPVLQKQEHRDEVDSAIEPRRLRVIVVDDNADAADTLAMLLRLNGHDVRIQYSAQAALDAAPDFRPDAVICDLDMPGMSGHELATRLRRDRRFATVLLIAVTGWGTEEDRRRTREAGFDHHLAKPVVVAAIEAILASR